MPSTIRWLSKRLLRYHALAATVAAAALVSTAWIWNTRAASGSDAYGYVSEAELFLHGNLHVDQPFVVEAPWPHADQTFSTLAYRPTPDGTQLVPTYSPGLPILMAAAKAAFGACAVYAVVPAMAGLLVLATYGIGRAIGRPAVGLAAAILVAASPTVLFMSMMPMSDVPSAALWAVVIALVLHDAPVAAALAGVATIFGILVRPNMAPLALITAAWLTWRCVVRPPRSGWRWTRVAWFACGPPIGVGLVMLIYARLYGSPFESGYGTVSHIFGFAPIAANLRTYGGWLISTETPLAIVGLGALAASWRELWTTPESRAARWLFAPCALFVWITYLTYRTFDAWWYLRFLLPSWPLMAVGTASILAAVSRIARPWTTVAVAVLVIFLAGRGLETAWNGHAFALWYEQAEYLEASRAVDTYAGPDAVIISREFSGSVRYYSGRLTLSYSAFDPEWLDRAVEWLDARGHHPYFLLTSDEVSDLRRHYAARSRLARLDWTPLMRIRGGDALLFDSVPRLSAEQPPEFPPLKRPRCQEPKPPPTLRPVASLASGGSDDRATLPGHLTRFGERSESGCSM